jgi:hypothetical protein
MPHITACECKAEAPDDSDIVRRFRSPKPLSYADFYALSIEVEV